MDLKAHQLMCGANANFMPTTCPCIFRRILKIFPNSQEQVVRKQRAVNGVVMLESVMLFCKMRPLSKAIQTGSPCHQTWWPPELLNYKSSKFAVSMLAENAGNCNPLLWTAVGWGRLP